MIKADIKFASGNTVRCIGRVGAGGIVVPWQSTKDLKSHIKHINDKGYAVSIIKIYLDEPLDPLTVGGSPDSS